MNVVKTRTHARDLPSTQEILTMMALEVTLAPTSNKHFPNFDSLRSWLEFLDLPTTILESTSFEEVQNNVLQIKPQLVEQTLKCKPVEILSTVQDYLGEQDGLKVCDIGIVFGGRTIARAEKGAELYLMGWVKKLLMTGKSPNYTSFFKQPEAIVFKNKAVELGVPEIDIFTEELAINIPDNVKRSVLLLQEMNFQYNRIASVISWYAQRRAWCTLKKFLPPNVEVVRVNATLPEGSLYKQNEWYLTAEGIEIVFNEFVKMKQQVLSEAA